MLGDNCEFFRIDHRPATPGNGDGQRSFPESWVVHLLMDDDDFLDATINDPAVAEALSKLPKRSRIFVEFSRRPVRDVWNAMRLTVERVGKERA